MKIVHLDNLPEGDNLTKKNWKTREQESSSDFTSPIKS